MRHALAAFALSLLLAAPAAAEPVLLRADLTVEGSDVTLGDLFDDAGDAADIVVVRAPAPGASLSIDPDYVRAAAARNGLEWANATGVRRITVTRASSRLDARAVAELIGAELMASNGQVYEVTLSAAGLVLHAPSGASGGPRVESVDLDPRSGLFQASILTHDGATPTRVAGRAFATIDAPVLARPVAAGQTITGADIDWIQVRADRLRPDAVLDADRLVGMSARRALRPGEPMRAYDLHTPVAIARGETVQLRFETGGLVLTVRARALANAGAGEMARFVNLQSNRTVEAFVEGPGVARVGPPPAVNPS